MNKKIVSSLMSLLIAVSLDAPAFNNVNSQMLYAHREAVVPNFVAPMPWLIAN